MTTYAAIATPAGTISVELRTVGTMLAIVPLGGTVAVAWLKDGALVGRIPGGTWGIVAHLVADGGDAEIVRGAERFTATTGRCSCCGRLLTAGQSVARGLGPVCAGKVA